MSANKSSPLLVFIGCATLDSIAAVDQYPEADSRTIADEFITAGGGPAATAAVAAARLGARTAFAGVIGCDDEGDRILAGLESEGVDTSAVLRSLDHRSGASLIIVSQRKATRAIFTRPVPALAFPALGAFHDAVESADWIHADHLGWSTIQPYRSYRSTIRLSVDAGNPIPGFTPNGVELYVPTIERLRSDYGPELPETQLLQRAIDAGARRVVATAGSEGVWVHPGSGPVVHLPAVPTQIISTLGAGDVFHGALLAAVAIGLDLSAAASLANEVAAESCTGLDGRSRIPRRQLTNHPAHTNSASNKGIPENVIR